MPTLRDAAELLTRATTIAKSEPLVQALGFARWLPLPADAHTGLGIDGIVADAHIAAGAGQLRALGGRSLTRDARLDAIRLATRAATHAPEKLWTACVVAPRAHAIAIAVAPPAGAGRALALSVEGSTIRGGDAESLALLIAARGPSDVLTHQRWREVLGRDALTARFYRELERAVAALADTAGGGVPAAARREMALLCASRLLFLAFLEAKGWLDGDREFLRHRFDAQCEAGGGVHRRFLDPLFFGTLNTPVARRAAAARALGRLPFLNGGLFARTAVERAHRACTFTDDAIGGIVCALLGRYRVTPREDADAWADAAVDPEMLGRAFESLMARRERRAQGVFYTPPGLIERVTNAGLREWLAGHGIPDRVRDEVLAGAPAPADQRAAVLRAVTGARVIDPACGSGAFLVHALHRLAAIRRLAGDRRPVDVVRRDVLVHSIFGVDVNPTAAWICELRLWLATVVESPVRDPAEVEPLPNLDHHIRVGDSLAGTAFDDPAAATIRVGALRARYVRATGHRKRTLGRALDREERRAALEALRTEAAMIAAQRRDLLCAARGRDLFGDRTRPTAAHAATLRALRGASRDVRARTLAVRRGGALPFAFASHFADAHRDGGFDLVLGNPPWVRTHRVDPAARRAFAARFRAWREARRAGGTDGPGFGAQVDLAALFLERAVHLARPGEGTVSFLVPSKLWSALSGAGIRTVLRDECRVAAVEDWAGEPDGFEAVTYPSLVVATRLAPGAGTTPAPAVRAAAQRGVALVAWEIDADRLALDPAPGAPWVLVPPPVRVAFDLLRARGAPLHQAGIGRVTLGVKTGCNAAFVVEIGDDAGPTVEVRSGTRRGRADRAFLRPVVRGEDATRWRCVPSERRLIFPHGPHGAPLDALPAATMRWLQPWRSTLDRRADAGAARRWWSVFRTEAARHDVARVVWSDIARAPRAAVLMPGDATVPLNTCYTLLAASPADALAFCALLNAAPIAAWLSMIAEPARGGYRRFLAWTIARVPVPADWPRARGILAPMTEAALAGSPPDARTLAVAVADAYRVRLSRLQPLMDWCDPST